MSENAPPAPGTGKVGAEGVPQKPFEPPAGSTSITLVRHGATEPAHVGKSFPSRDGHGDPDLAPEGREQAELVGRRLALAHKERPFDAVYVTSLVRTLQTAEPFLSLSGMVSREEPDLREVHLGEYEGGLLRIKGAEGDPVVREVYQQERWDVIPGAESWESFQGRCVESILRIRDEYKGGRVVVVVHGGVISAILSHVTGSRPFAFVSADNASLSEIVHLDAPIDRWMLRRFNDTNHLPQG
jgi:probable phosphoglycerate mutase